MFRLETPRLLIRPWDRCDREGLRTLTDDPTVMHYVHGGRTYSDEELDEFFERRERQLSEDGFCMGAVVEKATDRLIGISGVQPLGTTSDLEIGWILARDTWGRGYATEAGAAAMHYVLHTLGRDRVVAIIDPDNHSSIRVAERLGMTYEGRYTGVELGHRMPELVVNLYYRMREQ